MSDFVAAAVALLLLLKLLLLKLPLGMCGAYLSVPEDCLTKVVGEFLECPNLGFVQCRTTPLRAEDNYWEVGSLHG